MRVKGNNNALTKTGSDEMAQIKTFPMDCTTKCPHYKTWDMSVDDWTSYCDILEVQVDDCDGDYIRYRCPLEEGVKNDSD